MGVTDETRLVELNRPLDVHIARDHARLMAADAGFDTYTCTEIETTVAELGTNVLRYGVRGRALLRTNPDGFEVEVVDEGPGFGTVALPSHGLGIGLSGARRLMDELSVDNLTAGGRVRAKKSLRTPGTSRSRLAAAAAMSTVGDEATGGDAYLITEQGEGILVAIIDGLGHGSAASAAASQVIAHLRAHPHDPLEALIVGADRAARRGRGAVALVVRIDPTAGQLSYVGVGDVSGILLPDGERLLVENGCLGVRIPATKARDLSWEPGSVLVLSTDGVDLPAPLPDPEQSGGLQAWVEQLLIEGRTGSDDALVVALRNT